MLHERAIAPDYIPQPPKPDPTPEELAAQREANIAQLVAEVLDIQQTFYANRDDLGMEDAVQWMRHDNRLLVSFRGRLLIESAQAYDQLDTWLAPLGLMPLFRENAAGQHVVHIVEGRLTPPKPLPIWPNVVLFIGTIFSVLFVGATMAISEIAMTDPVAAQAVAENLIPNLWRGWPYALSILLILGSHEGGHYLMMRYHGVAATLPYFIPMPVLNPFGTFGAAIALRGPIRNRRHLLDIGASGPLAGMFFALPILLVGLSTSQLTPPAMEGVFVEGNSILYAMAKFMVFGQFLPNESADVLVNQVAWAGWTGLFVTALNLIPLGQLDGGHVLYSILGERARRLYTPLLIFILAMMLFISGAWLLLFVLLFLFGRYYAVPLDNITRLDSRRRWVAVGTLVLFALIFVPVPLAIPGQPSGLLTQGPAALGAAIVAVVFTLRRFQLR